MKETVKRVMKCAHCRRESQVQTMNKTTINENGKQVEAKSWQCEHCRIENKMKGLNG